MVGVLLGWQHGHLEHATCPRPQQPIISTEVSVCSTCHLVFLKLAGPLMSQIAMQIDAATGVLNQPDNGSRGDHKVVFQLPLIAVEDQVHAGVDLEMIDLAIGRMQRNAASLLGRCR